MTSNVVRLDDRRREMALIQFFEQWDLDIEARKLRMHWANQFGYLDADGKFTRHENSALLRGGPDGDYPCMRPEMVACASSRCQRLQRCRHILGANGLPLGENDCGNE